MKSSKHILVLIPGFPANEQDEACLPLVQAFFKEFNNQHPEYRFTVLSFEYPFQDASYSWKGLTVIPFNNRNRRLLFKILNWIKVARVAKTIHKKDEICLIHSFWMDQCALVGARLSSSMNLPHLVSLMGQDARSQNKYLKVLPLHRMYKTSLSTYQATQFKNSSGFTVNEVIPFGIDESIFPSSTAGKREIDLIGAGWLSKLKDYALFIRIVNRIKKTKPDVRAIIFGNGPEKEPLENLIQQLDLNDNVVLYGLASREVIFKHMLRSKVFLHTSSYESMGYVFLEAIKCGCNLVSKRVGLAEDQVYWKIAAEEAGLADAVEYFLNKNEQHLENRKVYKMSDTVLAYQNIYLEKTR